MIIASFYHFFDFPNFSTLQEGLRKELRRLDIKGSLLLAPEGINGTLAGRRKAIDAFLAHLKAALSVDFTHKESPCGRQPFGRTKVRLKKEIISLGVAHPRRMAGSGTNRNQTPRQARGWSRYVDARQWNALIADPSVTVLDARNSYETHLGTFERAIDPGIRTFKELPGFVQKNLDPARHRKIATFCTGGIRCEKFSAWLLEQGFNEVYQLEGGILKYLEDMPEADSRWRGECYVFDERIAVGHDLAPSETATMCKACGHALTPEDRRHPSYQKDERCPYCAGKPR